MAGSAIGSFAIGEEAGVHERARSDATVLVVDDNATDRRIVGNIVEKLAGCQVHYARNAREALAAMEQEAPSLVLTDLLMPELDGLKLVESVRRLYPQIPIVLLTERGGEDIAIRALQYGAASYIPKKSLTREIASTLEQVLTAARASQRDEQLLGYLSGMELQFALDNDADLVQPLVAHLQEHTNRLNLFDQHSCTRVGIALEEAISNAIHHGNLELSSELREDGSDTYHRLAAERRGKPPYVDRRVHVSARLSRLEAVFTIQDEGPGFDPGVLPDPTEPANIAKISGRGLLLIRTFMDAVQYNRSGNELTMRKQRSVSPAT